MKSLVCMSPVGDIEIWHDYKVPVDITTNYYLSGWMLELNSWGSVQYVATFGPAFWGRTIIGEL